jgi:hypothetical protein
MKRGALANPGARRRFAKAALSGIAADKATGTVYDIINQSINLEPQNFEAHYVSFFKHLIFKLRSSPLDLGRVKPVYTFQIIQSNTPRHPTDETA